MGVGEGRKEGREEEPEDDEEDSEADHDVYLVSEHMGEEDGRVSVGGLHLAWCSSDLVCQPDRRVFRCAAGYSGQHAFLTAKDGFRRCGASKCSSSSAAYSQTLSRLAEWLSTNNGTPVGYLGPYVVT
jgi:hypothetical protein